MLNVPEVHAFLIIHPPARSIEASVPFASAEISKWKLFFWSVFTLLLFRLSYLIRPFRYKLTAFYLNVPADLFNRDRGINNV